MRRPDFKKLAASFKGRVFRNGGYSTVLILVVTALVVAVNILVGLLPSAWRQIDTTSSSLYSLGESSLELLDGLQEDVTLYFIAQTGSEDLTLRSALERYDAASSHITLVQKDPVLYPTFTSQYTDGTVTSNSVIVASDKRSTIVDYASCYSTETSYDANYNQTSTTTFEGEGLITSAIDFVTSDNLPVLYQLSGHDEYTLDDALTTEIQQQNMDLQTLSLLTADGVPEDCDVLLILAPQRDLSEAEAEMIREYLDEGGHLLAFTDYQEDVSMPNFDSILAYYGLSVGDGMVFEGDANYYISGYPHYLVPEILSHEITDPLLENNYFVLNALTQPIEIDTVRSSVTITPLLETTDSAYLKQDVANLETLEKEDGDTTGKFTLAVAASEPLDDDKETRLVLMTSTYMLDSQLDAMVSGGNTTLFINALGWMCDREQSISIHGKAMTTGTLMVSEASASRLSFVFVGLLPAACLVAGIIIWIRRKHR